MNDITCKDFIKTTFDTSIQRHKKKFDRFKCNQCQRICHSLSQLQTHTYTMHGQFRCTVCKATFTQRSNLQRHSLRHVGFKPFECAVCLRAYFRKDHLVRHMESVHPDAPIQNNIISRLTSAESLDYLERMEKASRNQANNESISDNL